MYCASSTVAVWWYLSVKSLPYSLDFIYVNQKCKFLTSFRENDQFRTTFKPKFEKSDVYIVIFIKFFILFLFDSRLLKDLAICHPMEK